MKKGSYILWPAVLWLVLFLLVPCSMVAVFSFLNKGLYGQISYSFTLDNYLRFFDPLYLKILVDTLVISILTTVICLLLGYPLAYIITRMDRKWQNVLLLLVMVPFWINFLVRSFAWVIILRTQGLINTFLQKIGIIDEPLQLLYNNGAVLLGMVYALLPFMVLPVYVSIEKLDRRMLEAAYDLGATPFKAFWKVTLPLTMPGIIAGSILVFVPSLGMFVVPDIMGGAKSALIGNVIENQFKSALDWPFGSALSIILILLSLILIYFYNRILRMQDRLEGSR
jgi:spermidine/putrescine transport system permease protein